MLKTAFSCHCHVPSDSHVHTRTVCEDMDTDLWTEVLFLDNCTIYIYTYTVVSRTVIYLYKPVNLEHLTKEKFISSFSWKLELGSETPYIYTKGKRDNPPI